MMELRLEIPRILYNVYHITADVLIHRAFYSTKASFLQVSAATEIGGAGMLHKTLLE